MIIIIYSVCPIFTNPPDWRKALSNGVKTHLFKLKTTKISQGGALPYTGANTHKSKIPLKIRKYAFSAIAQFLGLIIQYGRPHGKNVNKHGRPHGKNVNKHSRLLEKLKTILK